LSGVDEIKVSVFFQLGNDIEWSFNIKAELLVEFSLNWFSWVFISVDNIPLLIDLTMLSVGNDVGIFIVFSSFNIEDLSFLVDKEWTFIGPKLPPS
jgi:hypothetical protein